MTAWWYTEEDKKAGPVETEVLKKLLLDGKISAKTMLWHEGMEAWQPLDAVDELNVIKATLPPPLPPKTEPDPLGYPLATRWPRFLARMFDVWWELLLVGAIIGAVLGQYSASYIAWMNEPFSSQLFSLICLPIGLILDAVIYRYAGNTPGKALLGLKVGTLRGESLSLTQYINRNFLFWVQGFALGIPLVLLITMANQSSRLSKGRQASYDEHTGFRVRSKPIRWLRKTTFGFAFASLFVVMFALNNMEKAAIRESILIKAQKNYTWENPITHLNTTIDSRWINSDLVNDDGQKVYMFSDQAEHAFVVFGMEGAAGISIDQYVRAFQKGVANNMRISDGGRFFVKDGLNMWEGTGTMLNIASNRLKVQVIQQRSSFWRVVTVQTMPFDYSETMTAQLQTALWNTVIKAKIL